MIPYDDSRRGPMLLTIKRGDSEVSLEIKEAHAEAVLDWSFFPVALAPQVAAAVWPEVVRALRNALAVIEEQQAWWEAQGKVVSGMAGCSDHERLSIWSALQTGNRALEALGGK